MSNNDATAKLVEAARAVADATFSTGVAVNPDEQKRALVKLVAICDAETLPPPSPAVAIEDATNPVCDPENVPTPPAPAGRDRLARRVAELERVVEINSEAGNEMRRTLTREYDATIADLRAKLAEADRSLNHLRGVVSALEAKLAAAGGGVDKELLETSRAILPSVLMTMEMSVNAGKAGYTEGWRDGCAAEAVKIARALHAALRQAGGGE